MTSEEYDKLSDEEKRIKVAELCGYKDIGRADIMRMEAEDGYVYDIPDYLNDLNACHKFEKPLDAGQYIRYTDRLCMDCDDAIIATAKQRCKAFVLTMENSNEQEKR